jgi:hypothetical protein
VSYYEQYAATPQNVGDWEGCEDLAASQVNRIYMALEQSIPGSIDPQIAANIFTRVWKDWGYDMRLLDLDDGDIYNYTQSLLRTAA